MVDGKDMEELQKKLERFVGLDRLFNEDGSVRSVEEVRNYKCPLL